MFRLNTEYEEEYVLHINSSDDSEAKEVRMLNGYPFYQAAMSVLSNQNVHSDLPTAIYLPPGSDRSHRSNNQK